MMAFWWLSATVNLEYGLLALFVSLVAAAVAPSGRECLKMGSLKCKVLALLSALGVCWGAYAGWNTASKEGRMQQMLPLVPMALDLISMACTVLSIWFVYVCLIWLYSRMADVFAELGTFRNLRFRELLIYAVLFLLVLCLVTGTFLQTDVVYGTEYNFDNVYTSDSSSLVKENVYLTLDHGENDIRQPLFAVFAAPFMGLPNLIVELLSPSAPVRAVIFNTAQLLLLFVTIFLLARMMKLSEGKRICFMLFACSSYTCLLFELMMEQYIVACFWLVFFLYLTAEGKQPNRLALWGAGGSLLTSMILIPFMSKKNPFKTFKDWFVDMVRYGLEFVAVIFLFFRYDVLFQLGQQAAGISGYTGSSVTFADKVFQYTHFVRNCLLAPVAGVDFTTVDHVSWKQEPVTGICILGVVIIALAILSAVVNRKKKSSLLAAYWVGFSMLLLLVMGWGTAENGLILYALYFGWAFFQLLFQLLEWVAEKLGAAWLVPVGSLGAAAAMLAVNLPAILELVNFGITYYPV